MKTKCRIKRVFSPRYATKEKKIKKRYLVGVKTHDHLDKNVSSDLSLADRYNLGLLDKPVVLPFIASNAVLELALQLGVHRWCTNLL
jgi:hypothetical protein